MLATPNKQAIKKLSIRSLRANRMRNWFAIVAIALTTMLFTSLFTIGASMLASVEQSTMRQVGTSAHGGFKYLTTEQYQKLKDHKLIKEQGLSVMVNVAENEQLIKRSTEIRFADETYAKFMFALPTTGRMPEQPDEIATDTLVLDRLGIPHEVGQKVKLKYTIDGQQVQKEFVLSGFYEGDIVIPASMIWVSESFIEQELAGIDQSRARDGQSYTGLLFADVMLDNSVNIEGKLNRILEDNGFTERDIPIGVNWAYAPTQMTLDIGMIAGVAGGILLIMLSGYLIIYNIFYISIAKDIKFYGLLKTIGTTPKQLKKLVRRQAWLLSCVGIPLGLLAGYAVGAALVPVVMQMMTMSHVGVSIHPLIFVGSALFALLTVFISCNKPAKTAAGVSPIEAVRYTDVSGASRKGLKKSISGAKLHRMAFSNVFRNKKKAVIVLSSLSLSIILLNSVYTMVTGFDMDKYLETEIQTDFVIGDVGLFNVNIGFSGQDTVTEELVASLASREDVEDIGSVYFTAGEHPITGTTLESFQRLIPKLLSLTDRDMQYSVDMVLADKKMPMKLHGLDEFAAEHLEIKQGTYDAEKFKSGDYIVVMPNYKDEDSVESIYEIGEQVTLAIENGEEKTYEVMALGTIPHSMSSRWTSMLGLEFFLPATEIKQLVSHPTIMTTVFDVTDEQTEAMEQYLAHYVDKVDPMLDYESRATYAEEFKSMQSTFTGVGYTLCSIIALIGILNFINSMVTSIISRRNEIAMLQSIGMTNRQVYKMLMFEGFYFALLTLGIVCTFGMLLTYFGVSAFAGQFWFFSYHFTVLPIAICTPLLIMMALAVPMLSYRTASRMSIVERLREME
ncbi:ABC transporter permease [Paenibacillus marinisediminis]